MSTMEDTLEWADTWYHRDVLRDAGIFVVNEDSEPMWFAPAGLNRKILNMTIEKLKRLK